METVAKTPSIARPNSTDKTIHRILCIVAPVIGLMIPGFYDWTGSDQSRPSPWVLYAFLVLVSILLVFWGWLIFCHVRDKGNFSTPLSSSQWSIKHLLITTFAVAIYLGVWTAQPLMASGMLIGGVLFFSVWTIARIRAIRWQMCSLLSCAYLPFLWCMWQNFERPYLTPMITSLPSILPWAMISSYARQNFQQLSWLGLLLTSLQLIIGILLIRSGAKLGLAYNTFVLVLSIVGSFALNALVRA